MSVPSAGSQGSGKTRGRHKWQGKETLFGQLLDYLYKHRFRQGWSALIIAALALFVWLVWLLCFAPQRTSFVVLSAAPYSWPLPPNAFGVEDIEKLAFLDEKSLSLRGAEDPVVSKAGFLDRLKQEIQVLHLQSISQPLIIYLSMHGLSMHALEDPSSQKIFLIPPQADPIDSTTWIDFKDDLLHELKDVEPERSTLLILDCQRMQVNWNIGLLANHFSERVQAVLGDAYSGKLAVLLAAGPDEHANTSPDLRGSTFGHFLRQGLAGSADIQPDSGNRDGWVSLAELQAFLSQNVNHWALQNRGTPQSPMLLKSNPNLDFRLTRSLNREALSQLLESDKQSKREEPNIAASRLDSLWRHLQQLREMRLYQSEPVAWRKLEHHLLWLEQLSIAGRGYRDVTLRVVEEVEVQLKAVEARLDILRESRSINNSFTVISGDTWPLPDDLEMHSKSLVDYFGIPESTTESEVDDQIKKFYEQPTRELLAATLAAIEKKSGRELMSAHFVRMLARYQSPRLWERPQMVRQLLKLQDDISDLTVPRDSSGLPAQERVHGWVRSLLSNVQVVRRQAEDSLFVHDQPELTKLLDELQLTYQKTATASRELQEILASSDRALAEMPYLAQWITHPLRKQNVPKIQETVNDHLLPLIMHSQDLSKKLAHVPLESDEYSEVLTAINRMQDYATRYVSEPLTSLTDEWRNWCTQLVAKSEADRPESAGELEAALSIPLASWESRRDLRDARNRLEVRLSDNYDGRQTQEPQTDHESYAERMANWTSHPLLSILGQHTKPTEHKENPLQILLDEVEDLLVGQAKATSLVEQRETCSEAELRIRAAAPLWFDDIKRDPILELRQLDLQSLLIWHAKSSLDDFWGPAGQDRAFFDLAASDYLKAADAFSALQVDTKTFGPTELLNARLASSRRAASTWISTLCKPALQLAPDDQVQSTIAVTAAGNSDAVPNDAAHEFIPPDGTATVSIRDVQGRLYEASIQPTGSVSLPPANAQLTVTLNPDVVRSNNTLQAITMFRGHEYPGPVNIDKLEGITIDLSPHQYERSEVTLNSPWQKLSVIFILDCSQSMQNPLTTAGSEAAASRLDIAKAALQDMLIALSMRRNARVGVQLFGHRVGWSTVTPVRRLMQPDLASTVAAGVSPSADVESVMQLRSFDLSAAQSVIPKINDAKPWGQSPLYLSVVQALNEFGDNDADAERHVIVITDGANYQYIPSTEAGVKATTEEDVRIACAEHNVPVHILGLGMDRSREKEATEKFAKLCVESGGRYQSLTKSTDLTQALSHLLGPANYRLQPADASQFPDQEATLGSPIRFSPPPSSTQRFWLSYEGRKMVDPNANAHKNSQSAKEILSFQGGESLQLFVDEKGDAIHAFAFEENVAEEAKLIDSQGESTAHVVRLHQPHRTSKSDIAFPISWQQLDTQTTSPEPRWQITQRPANVWVEVQPMSSANNPVGQAYVFFDTNYEPDQPVPVINFVARNWPPESKRVRIRLWCQPLPPASLELLPSPAITADQQSTELNLTIRLDGVLKSPISVTAGVTLRVDQPSSQIASDLQKLRFVLDFDETAPPITSIKLSLPQSRALPVRILRQFDAKHRIAVHTFFFDSKQAELPEAVILSNDEREHKSAWQLQEPIILELPESGNFLPVP